MEDRVVHHEAPGYEYRPQGLMAEDWGKTGHRTEPPAFVTEGNLRNRAMMDNDKGRDSLMYIWSLDDETVLKGCREGKKRHREIVRRLGGSIYDEPPGAVNPSWVTMQCANTAYDRGLIDERELDRIVD